MRKKYVSWFRGQQSVKWKDKRKFLTIYGFYFPQLADGKK